MKRSGSLTMDMMFSIMSILTVTAVCAVSVKNLMVMDRRTDAKLYLEEKIEEESKREIIKNENREFFREITDSEESYMSGKYSVEIQRKLVDEKYEVVRSEIKINCDGISRKTVVYSIISGGEVR